MDIITKVDLIRRHLKKESDAIINQIDIDLPVIPPFKGKEEIKLIIIGQDPTVKDVKSRKRINITLNLDKKGKLKTYLDSICKTLDISIDNVYATNVFKYFYSIPPANTLEVLFSHLEPNLELLKEELMEFPNIPIITLGEPVLQLLEDEDAKVRDYWGYDTKTKKTNGVFKYSSAKDNKLCRDFYPMPHQPSISKEFYMNNLTNYVSFIKNNI